MSKSKALLGAAVAVAGGVVVVSVLIRPAHLPDESRHVQTHLMTLTSYGSDVDPVWVYESSDRDFKIRPDGSGEISTHFVERTFPTPAEEAQWRDLPEGSSDDMHETYGPGKLFFQPSDDVRDGIDDFALRLTPSGDALRQIATLLTETVPSTAVQESALAVARGLIGVEVVDTGNRVAVTGLNRKGNLKVTLVFELAPVRYVEEIWTAQVSVEGLDLAPPFVSYDMTTILSEPWSGS
jgi:hypothetical protein